MLPHPDNPIFSADKSHAIGISITLLLAQTLCAVSFSLWGAAELSHDSIAINLAGRQRMLIQRLAKTLLELDYSYKNHSASTPYVQELTLTDYQFERTLSALNKQAIGNQKQKNWLQASSGSTTAKTLIEQAAILWAPTHLALQPLLADSGQLSAAALNKAVVVVMNNNQQLLSLMNGLTNETEEILHKQSVRIRSIEILVLSLILINFGAVLFYFRRQLNQLMEHKILLRNIMQSTGTAIIILNDKGAIQLCNPAAEKLFGYPTAIFTSMNIRDLLDAPFYTQIGKRNGDERFTLDIDLAEMTGTTGRRLFIASMHDLSDQTQRETQLRHLAHHDPLTGLPNRLLFMDRLTQTVARAHRHNEQVGLLYIDLDRFKPVNDKLGHAIGDLLLQQIAARLLACIRETDTVTRLGGDEFSIILDLPDDSGADTVTRKILTELSREFLLYDHPIQISASIGLSLYPHDSIDGNIDSLLLYADIAMYKAKALGGNTCCNYSEPTATTAPYLF